MIKQTIFGTTKDGREVKEYTVENAKGMSFSAIEFGAVIRKIFAKDKNGKLADVVLGYDSVQDYESDDTYLGAVVGRYANRIGKAAFTLNGVEYKLDVNDNDNHLHGGFDGYDKRVWASECFADEKGEGVKFMLVSEDGDQGYPGKLELSVKYTLTNENELIIEYTGMSDKDTICNITNHSYFNLAGHDSGDVLKQLIWLNSDFTTETDEFAITTGKLLDVKGTPMDFTTETAIGARIDADYYQVKNGSGYDHNWVIKGYEKGKINFTATLRDAASGRKMEVYTDLPGVQVYSGNFLKARIPGKNQAKYTSRTGVCFETQYYPDSINKPEFPSPVLKAGEEYKTTTIYKFMSE